VGSLQDKRTESGVEGREGPEVMGEEASAVLAGLAGNEEDGEDGRVVPLPVWVGAVRREDEVVWVGVYDPTE
jgi:hypothetical protein